MGRQDLEVQLVLRRELGRDEVDLHHRQPQHKRPHQTQHFDDAGFCVIEVLFDDAGWVANRWCELLPISLAAKQKLMELDDPVIRLSIVDGYLRDKKVVVG